jgi:hypothetical protein
MIKGNIITSLDISRGSSKSILNVTFRELKDLIAHLKSSFFSSLVTSTLSIAPSSLSLLLLVLLIKVISRIV